MKGGGGEEDSSSAMIQKEVSKRLTLGGFEDVVVSEQTTSVSGTRATKVSGRKPEWERGVTFSLGEKKTKKTLVSKASAWEEDDDDRDEMIDEDALLTEKDKAKPNPRKEKALDVRRRGNRAKIAPAEGKRKRR